MHFSEARYDAGGTSSCCIQMSIQQRFHFILSYLQADAAAHAEALKGGADSVNAELVSARTSLAEAVSERDEASSARIEADRRLAEAESQLADAKSESSLAPFHSMVQGPNVSPLNYPPLHAVTLSRS